VNGINKDSVVFEIGAYDGAWARTIESAYHPRLYLFEPQKWAYERCVEAFKNKSNVRVFNFALGVFTGTGRMGDFQSDGASLMKTEPVKCDQVNPRFQDVEIVAFDEFLASEKIDYIDLCQMNTEGYEYFLIPYLIEKGLITKIKYLACQFHMHPWFPLEEKRIMDMVDLTHNRVIGEPAFVSWERK